MILQAWLTLPSCLTSSSRPALARMIFWSLVMTVSPEAAVAGAAQPRPASPPPRLKVRVRKDTVRQIKLKLSHVDFVERDLGVLEVRLDPRFERRPHVDAGVGDRLALAAVRLEEIREFLHRRGVLAVGHVDDFAPRHVDEQADIVVAAPRRGFVG